MPRAQIVKGAKKVGSAIEDLRRVDPVIAAEKAWSPTPSQDTFHEQLPETLSIIKKAHGGEIKTNKEAIVGANKALKEHKDTFSKWMARAKANRAYVSGDAIVKATWDAIPETLKRENPKRAQAIIKEAQRAYGGKRLSVDMADQFRQEKTADLKSFYGKSTGGQISAVSGTSPEVVLKAQRDALANELYNALDPQGKGAGPRAIRTQQAHIIDVLDAARRRETMATASKPVSKAAAVAGAAPKLVQSVVGGPGMGYIKAADIVNPETLWAGSVDPWVRKAFKAVGEPTRTSLPQPGPWVTPVPRNLLPPPRGRTVTPSAGQPLVTPAPPGSTPQSGPLPRQYPPGSGNNRLLAPPSQVQQPGFAVQDMVPVTDPHTGRLTYVPQHWEEGQIPATSTADPYPPKAIPEAPQTPPAISNSTRATDPQGRKLTPRQRLALARLRRKRQAQA